MTWPQPLAVLTAFALLSCSSTDAPLTPSNPQHLAPPPRATLSLPTTAIFEASLWDDGMAEVNTYDATRGRYGRTWNFPLTLITVKEDFDAEAMVKADAPGRSPSLPVLKSHIYYDMPTVTYPYHFAASTFIHRREPLRLIKLTATSSEWCGITHRVLRGWTTPPALEYRSYFGAENEGVAPLEWPDNGFTEEQLLISLRALSFREGFEASIWVLDRQVDSHAGAPLWREGTLRVRGREPVMSADEREIESWLVEITLANGGTLAYAFSVEAPHVLVHHRGPDGFTMRLRESRRWDYWNF